MNRAVIKSGRSQQAKFSEPQSTSHGRGFRRAFTTCLFLLAFCLLSNAAVVAEELRASTPPSREVSRREILNYVGALLAAGRIEDAQVIVDQIPATGAFANDKLFLQAKIFEAQGNWRAAERAYREILKANPDLHRVRLDLALLLFQRGNFDAADYHFRLVLAADIPEEVQRKILLFLSRIRTDRWWLGWVQIAVAPDTNINTGPDRSRVTIFGLPFELSDEATQESGVGLQFAADGELRPRLAERVRYAVGGNLFSLDYSNRQFDDQTVTGRTGPVFLIPRGELALYGTVFRRWFGGELYSDGYGGLVRGSYDATQRLLLVGQGLISNVDNKINDGLDGPIYSLSGNVTYTLSDRSFLQLFGGWTREDREDPASASHRYRIGVGASRELFWGLVGYIAPEVHLRPFDERSIAFGATRRDTLYRIEGRLLFARQVLPDLAPFISLIYDYNDSNIDFFTYRRFRASLGFTKRF